MDEKSRPDPKSRTAQDIAWQILCEERMLSDALENGTAEWTPTPAPYLRPMGSTVPQIYGPSADEP